MRHNICYLISDVPAARGVHSDNTAIERMVPCVVKSVTRSEFYQAHNEGLSPNYVLALSHYAEYNDEPRVRYEGKIYNVIRIYISPNDNSIELTIQRSDVNG